MQSLYATRIKYNFLQESMKAENARIVMDLYSLSGKYIEKISEKVFKAYKAEYSTCRDCPEAWSFYGEEVTIYAEEYVHVLKMFLKLKGNVIFFMPYFVFPIKKERQTGFLPPALGVSSSRGLKYIQPFFLDLGPSTDATLSAGVWGERGYSQDLEFRHVFGQRRWVDLYFFNAFDSFYRENGLFYEKQQGERKFLPRNVYALEHRHAAFGNNYSHYLFLQNDSDPYSFQDWGDKTRKFSPGGPPRIDFFSLWRGETYQVFLEGKYLRNPFFADQKRFDPYLVQRLPELSYSFVPFTLFNTEGPFFRSLTLSLQGRLSRFRQTSPVDEEEKLSNNAYKHPVLNLDRSLISPKLSLHVADLGPFKIEQFATFNLDSYYRAQSSRIEKDVLVKDKRYLHKYGAILQTSASLQWEKIFDQSYQTIFLQEEIDLQALKDHPEEVDPSLREKILGAEKQKSQSKLMLPLAPYDKRLERPSHPYVSHGYKDSHQLKFIYSRLVSESSVGSNRLRDQFSQNKSYFDDFDLFKNDNNKPDHEIARVALPTENVLEVRYDNWFIRKTPTLFNPYADGTYLKNHFSYSILTHYYLSQGINFNTKVLGLENQLTRTLLGANFNLKWFSLNWEHYFFYKTKEHKSTVSFSRDWGLFSSTLSYSFDEFGKKSTEQIPDEAIGLGLVFKFIPDWTLSGESKFDFKKERWLQSKFQILHLSPSKCWGLGVVWQIGDLNEKNERDKKVMLDLRLNLDGHGLQSSQALAQKR